MRIYSFLSSPSLHSGGEVKGSEAREMGKRKTIFPGVANGEARAGVTPGPVG